MSASSTVVLVTGCTTGGIGFALCEAFAARGCTVYASARRLESMTGFKHDTIIPIQLDVTKNDDVQLVIKTIIDRSGSIDLVVNNAGVLAISPLADIPMERFEEAYDTNVFGPVRVAKAVIPHMAARRRGTIVNIGSVVGETPTPWSGAYASSKASLKSLSEVLEMECSPFGIHVMHVAPGGVKSNISINGAAKFSLPSDSLYKGWLHAVLRRIHQSQEPGTTDTDVFANAVATAALRSKPPRYYVFGSNSWFWVVIRWLPRDWVLRFMWRLFAGQPKTTAKL